MSGYTVLFLAFLVSGLIHVAGDMGAGLPVRQTGSLQFFCTQALGIMAEDAVLGRIRKRSITSGQTPAVGGKDVVKTGPSVWEKLFGYLWVLLFLSWSTPMWVFPVMHFSVVTGRHDSIVPYGVVGWVQGVVR